MLILWGPAAAGAQAYALQRGDTLALSVVGAPELQQSMTIDVDGNIVVPLVGPVPAVGRSLESVTVDLRTALSQVNYSVVSGSGELTTLQILPNAVTVTIADYRPIYVDGDVQSPGSFGYVPGLTARRAIALAGGYGLAQLRGGDPVPQLLAAQADLRRALADKAAIEARIARVRAQLGEGGGEAGAAPQSVSDGSLAATLSQVEGRRLDAGRRRSQELEEHYTAALAKVQGQIETLEERLKSETEGVVADTEDFQRLLEAQSKGTVSAARLSDGRRTLLFSTTRELQTKSELDRAQMELENLDHERDRTRIDERASYLAELGEALLALEAADAGVSASRRLVTYLQGAAADPELGGDVVVVITSPDGHQRRLAPGEDPILQPGDLVDVQVKMPALAD
jgi:polysaccharide export outer membrane protein